MPEHCFRAFTRTGHPLGNIVITHDGVTPDELGEAVGPLCAEAVPSAVLLTNGHDVDLASVLSGNGYVAAETMPLMSVTPDMLNSTDMPSEYELVEVTPDHHDLWLAAFAAGYEIPADLASCFAPLKAIPRLEPGSARYYAAEINNDFAAVSMTWDHGGAVGVYCVATRPEHRRRGLAAHLTAESVQRAWSDGPQLAVLQSSAAGRSMYERLGFTTQGEMTLFVRLPG
ncbi:MAG: GNAT family N-acetyltransferase [Phycisphaerales bacterium JB040]